MSKLYYPATQENREAIWSVLGPRLRGDVLEVASGSGEHGVYFAGLLQEGSWTCSDPDPANRASIAEWTGKTALDIDARTGPWPEGPFSAVVAINLLHIAPWAACPGLFRGAAQVLGPGGFVYLYGAYRRPGRPFEPSNQAFDEGLRRQNPEWGVRDLALVEEAAAEAGFHLSQVVEMPSNNLSLFFKRAARAHDALADGLVGQKIQAVRYCEIDYEGGPLWNQDSRFDSLDFGLELQLADGRVFPITWGYSFAQYDICLEPELHWKDCHRVWDVSETSRWKDLLGVSIRDARILWATGSMDDPEMVYPQGVWLTFSSGQRVFITALEIREGSSNGAADHITVFFDEATARQFPAGI